MKKIPTWQPVVAAALKGNDGLWLMHKRPLNKHHGGLWEFPGGKVEDGEVPVNAMVRELNEELGISVKPEHCIATGFAQEAAIHGGCPIVILLYTLMIWDGEPQALEGGAVKWFRPEEMVSLEKPPLDVVLLSQIFKKDAN